MTRTDLAGCREDDQLALRCVGPTNIAVDPHVGLPHVSPVNADELIKAGGGPSRIGKKLGINHASVIGWRKTGRVPVGHVLKLEEITGIPRHQIRPDIYQAPPQQTDTGHATTPADAGPPYGSTEWLIARRNERPAININSVDLLNDLHDET